jgi:cyclopropane fatty-acyl-phospholipid synthase-like methyltransferase
MPLITDQSVLQYYEQNTRLFSWFGNPNQARSIHRALWLPGVQNLGQALVVSNELVLEEVQDLERANSGGSLRLADLGCGIGGTLFFLLRRITPPVLAIGMTISPVQAGMAQSQVLRESGEKPIGLIIADFQAAPLPTNFMDLAYSIEAFTHALYPASYLEETARLLRPGGRLVLIDDFLSETILPATDEHRLWLGAFRQGWRLPGLHTPAWVVAEAARHGLVQVRGRILTAWLKLRTFPDWAANLVLKVGVKLPLRHAIWSSLMGSLALQHCLNAGLVEYRMLVFERQD